MVEHNRRLAADEEMQRFLGGMNRIGETREGHAVLAGVFKTDSPEFGDAGPAARWWSKVHKIAGGLLVARMVGDLQDLSRVEARLHFPDEHGRECVTFAPYSPELYSGTAPTAEQEADSSSRPILRGGGPSTGRSGLRDLREFAAASAPFSLDPSVLLTAYSVLQEGKHTLPTLAAYRPE